MVSFIILNYNSSELTLKCVKSIEKYVPSGSYEVIVVNNGGSEEQRRMVSEAFVGTPHRIVECRWNGGFGLGNMFGANVARGEYLCFLNSDILLIEDCITPLCAYLEQHPDVGCITPQQFNAKGERVSSFNHAPGLRHDLIGDSLAERWFPKRYPSRKRDYTGHEPFAVTQINGCFMLFSATAFWKIGGFDTNIFLYFEEYDLAVRLRRQGFQSVLHPEYKFQHIHGATIRQKKSMALRELFISKMYVFRKHHPWWLFALEHFVNFVTLCAKPHKWYIVPALFHSEAMSQSMRHQK